MKYSTVLFLNGENNCWRVETEEDLVKIQVEFQRCEVEKKKKREKKNETRNNDEAKTRAGIRRKRDLFVTTVVVEKKKNARYIKNAENKRILIACVNSAVLQQCNGGAAMGHFTKIEHRRNGEKMRQSVLV
jgi:UDP-N-acetylmuramoylalanine-D-glutamate ligase